MTLTIDLTSEQETRLMAEAERNGLSVQDYVLYRALAGSVSDASAADALALNGSLADFLKGYVGAFAGQSRQDGRPWSHIEAACDDAPYA